MRDSRFLSPRLALRLLIHPTLLNKGLTPSLVRRGREGSAEAGLTLIECLVAIIIVTLTILAITPPILLATGTRVQSRRAEQANQVAQAEVDRVRSLIERNVTNTILLPAVGITVGTTVPAATVPPTPGNSAASPLQSPSDCGLTTTSRYPFPVPTPPANPPQLPAANLVKVDIDGDCTPEYVMQVFRRNDERLQGAPATAMPSNFEVTVRVYSYFPDQTFPTLQTERTSLVSGTSTRERLSGNRQNALAVLTSNISVNNQSSALGRLCVQARGGVDTACNF